MNAARDRAGRGAFGCLASLVLLGVVGYAGVIVGPPWLHYQQFRDEMRTQARFGVSLPDSVIRARLVARADSLHLPKAARHVIIARHHGQFPTITISAEYDEPIHIAWVGTTFLHFKPSAEEPL